jgi:hypothetical protein
MIRPLLLGLVLFAGASMSAARADNLPPGSWGGSCNSATVQGTFMSAQCRTTAGDKRWSSIDFSRCPGYAVANDQGQLVCDRDYNNGGNNNYGRLPPGSWVQSCRNGKMRNGQLYASCQKQNGSWRDTSIDPGRCNGNAVGNDNGNLVCENSYGRMPGGSWSQTCRNGNIQNGQLYASCQKTNGKWKDSSIDYRSCRDNQVANNDGRLVCQNDMGSAMPGGSWSQTCRNGNTQNGQLYASCQRMNGGWRDSSIDYRRCQNNQVANDDGRLVCQSDVGYGTPGGSWTRSCRNGNVQNGQLYATCQKMNGNWKDSSLDLSRCPRGPVGNNDGRLYCE